MIGTSSRAILKTKVSNNITQLDTIKILRKQLVTTELQINTRYTNLFNEIKELGGQLNSAILKELNEEQLFKYSNNTEVKYGDEGKEELQIITSRYKENENENDKNERLLDKLLLLCVQKKGKLSTARRTMERCYQFIFKKLRVNPSILLKRTVKQIKPIVHVYSIRKGRRDIYYPCILPPLTQKKHAIRFVYNYAKLVSKKTRFFHEAIAIAICDGVFKPLPIRQKVVENTKLALKYKRSMFREIYRKTPKFKLLQRVKHT